MAVMKSRIAIRTLIIDDDEALCRKLYGWLEEAAYDPITFTDPGAGVDHVRRAPCELALVDLKLPDRDGAEVIASLCEACPDTRIVAMSAFPDTPQVIAAVRAGARDLLEKPIQPPALLDALQRQLAGLGIHGRTESEFNERLGARLRAIRRDAKRTLEDVAAVGGISAPQLSQIENGRTATSTWTLARLCAALQTPLARVFERI